MPVINRIADFATDMTAWRRHLHMHPELQFECHETAKFVVKMLTDFGVDEIHEGIAKTGVVAIINGKASGPTIGLRAMTIGSHAGLRAVPHPAYLRANSVAGAVILASVSCCDCE